MKRSQNRANTSDRQAGGIVDAIALASYDAGPMTHPTSGQTNLTAIAILLGIVITAVWVWKRLSLDTQDYLIDQAIPIALLAAVCLVIMWLIVRAVRRRQQRLRRREMLLARFARETAPDKRLETAFALVEVNNYRLEGLESELPALKELFAITLQRAVGDKQHRLRGMAASHLGVLQDLSIVPLLVKALEDDHAYVRSCAALALGRLRAIETKARLVTVMQEDWDQTVRSRAKEALERMGA
ncbi:MAG TPA: HEAT repeat domain-containing protein [Nitrospira sp.]|nr:HEAT repeat domain-containing protein [Nitrospira sp.]